jgi:hypothetical protein
LQFVGECIWILEQFVLVFYLLSHDIIL